MIRDPIPWPNGARCAACVTFDMDADSRVHIAHPTYGHSRVSAISMLQHGPKVAIPRILDSYPSLGLGQTFFFPAWCVETYPVAVEAILKGGHEIAHHGYLREHPRDRRAPLYNFSHHSADLLAARGDVWFAPMEEIAAHVQAMVANGQWQPRIDRLPYYVAPVRVT
ncbi:MAG: polysaccharide deacetylase family protein [Paracoccaceae bacterium]